MMPDRRSRRGISSDPWTAAIGIVCLIALAIRLHHVTTPLWVDEIYSYVAARAGPAEILANSRLDPHPPLFYLLGWLLSLGGRLTSEAAWRWFPVVCGTLVVSVVWRIARPVAGRPVALLTALVAATAPELLYLSQDFRPIVLATTLAAVGAWLTMRMLVGAPSRRQWTLWTAVALLGLYTAYVYILVAGVQWLSLGIRHVRTRAWWASTGVLLACALPLVPIALHGMRVFDGFQGEPPLSVWRVLQTLTAGEPMRYGVSVAHTAMPALAVVLVALGVVHAVRSADPREVDLALQVLLPVVTFFGLAQPVLGVRFPESEGKQFAVLLPAVYAVMAGGLALLAGAAPASRWWRQVVVLFLAAAMVVLNVTGVQAYFRTPKSAAGEAVTVLRERLAPGDTVVSLHYALDFAAAFYVRGVTVYFGPAATDAGYLFVSGEPERLLPAAFTSPRDRTVAEIQAHRRFWIWAVAGDRGGAVAALSAGCRTAYTETVPPYEAILVTCP